MTEFVMGNYVDKKIRKNNLRIVAKYLNNNNIRWFIMCGTLLGCMREKDFIDWDADIDIGVVGKDFNKIQIQYFIDRGFTGLKNCLLFKKTSISKDGCHVDFYNIKEKKDYFLFDIGSTFQYEMFRKISYFIKGSKKDSNKGTFKQEPLLEQSPLQVLQHIFTIPNYKYFPKCKLIKHKFVGIHVYIPAKWKQWLILLYGKTWWIPNPDYTDSKERQNNRRKKKL